MKRNFITFKSMAMAALFCGAVLTSCEKDPVTGPTTGPSTDTINGSGSDSISAQGTYVLAGTINSNGQAAYMLTTNTLDEGTASAIGNGLEADYASSATWVFYKDKYLYRLAYNQGQAGTTAAFYLDANDNKLAQREYEYTISNFTAYGIYQNEIILTGTGATDTKDAADNTAYGINFSIIDVDKQIAKTRTILAEDFLGTGEYVMLAGLCEANGKIYSGVVPLGCTPYGVAAGAVLPGNEDLVHQEAGGQGGGSYEAGTLSATQYPNNCYVAIFDDDSFTNPTIVQTDKMSWAAGRMRAAYYQMVWPDDQGDIYVFSSAYAKLESDDRQKTTHPSSIMRIKAGATEFDSSYEPFNIEEASNGNEVYRCWHVTGDYFLLQMYTAGVNAQGKGATRMAIFKGNDRTFNYVEGLPASDVVTSFSVKNPYNENGVCYIAVATTDSEHPVIYKVDPATATATAGITVEMDELVAIGKLTAQNN